jgi:hypothetical protein
MEKNYGRLRPEGAGKGFNIRREVRNLKRHHPHYPWDSLPQPLYQ